MSYISEKKKCPRCDGTGIIADNGFEPCNKCIYREHQNKFIRLFQSKKCNKCNNTKRIAYNNRRTCFQCIGNGFIIKISD